MHSPREFVELFTFWFEGGRGPVAEQAIGSRIDDALAATEEALAIQEDIDDAKGATTTRVNAGELYFLRGDWEQAREAYLAGRESARDLGQQRMEAVVSGDLGELAVARGDLDAAAEHFREAIATCERLGHDRQLANWRSHLAELQCLRGDLAEA